MTSREWKNLPELIRRCGGGGDVCWYGTRKENDNDEKIADECFVPGWPPVKREEIS